mmetsp:Transcript_58455/g.161757  ORF Transcript_58455/g.161757 Transcript_58455/m.161757 type:complete len:195 (-) Transcript_58455:402-986(-)
MANTIGDAGADPRRKVALSVLCCGGTKTLLAICCSVPGRVIPTTKICVDDKVRLRDVLAAWAEGVMKSQDGEIPDGARVFGSSATSLDLDATLRALRPQLPVRDGRLTVSVVWPKKVAQLPGDSTVKSANSAVSNPKLPPSSGTMDLKGGGQAKEYLEKAHEKAKLKAALAKQKLKDRMKRAEKKKRRKRTKRK